MLDLIKPLLGHNLDPEQRKVVECRDGLVWVVAGPGSGKTEVLVIRTLVLLFVDEINPNSIIVTTFTEKAANNLFNRIINYSNLIFKTYPNLEQQIDIYALRIGTLHSLCHEIMQEFKYPEYENYRLLDDLEQGLFIHEHSILVKEKTNRFLPLWEFFSFFFDGWDPVSGFQGWKNHSFLPNRWRRANAGISLFDRVIEDMLDLDKMAKSGSPWDLLVEAYNDYKNCLESHKRCDFAHVQQKFLKFLETPLGQQFFNGQDDLQHHPGIRYVMVDEYQDTNPIQETIYLKLIQKHKNLCIVGDDDQALYRFRGGTVDCMVTFDLACQREWGIQPKTINKYFLNGNYRSHPKIVQYYDEYITSFKEMQLPQARVSGKPKLLPQSSISGDYPSVAYIRGDTIPLTAADFAQFVKDLIKNGIIEQPNQCVLLMRSVKETKFNAKPFADALRNVGISPYNPRSRTFLEQDEIKLALGAFISIIDPKLKGLAAVIGSKGVKELVNKWITFFQKTIPSYPELQNYVNQSIINISKRSTNEWLDVNILEVYYRILAHQPFSTWQSDPEITYRLGRLTQILEAYSSIPFPNKPGSNRGDLKTSSTNVGEISFNWREGFYYSLAGLFVSSGLNDPEDEALICPPGRFPILTVHQAKGLEFPFVFVYGLNDDVNIDSSIKLEEKFIPFRKNPPFVNIKMEDKAAQDRIRFYYVAYSRAMYALIHLVPEVHKTGFGFLGQDLKKFKLKVKKI